MAGYIWWIGVAVVAWKLFGLAKWVYFHFVQKPQDWTKYKGKFALITGASGGIGAAIANVLARHGINVILVSRTQSKLDKLAAEISAKHKVTAVPIAFDCARDMDDFGELIDAVSDYEVSVLVNNVGGSGYEVGQTPFEQLKSEPDFRAGVRGSDLARLKTVTDININPTVALTHALLPGMVERKLGRIMNITSLAGEGMPFLTEYGGSKAYVNAFSRGLVGEVSSLGIEVQAIIPGDVSTYLNTNPVGPTCPSAETYGEHVVAKSFRGGSQCVPFPAHGIILWMSRTLPESVALWLFNKIIARLHDAMEVTHAAKKNE